MEIHIDSNVRTLIVWNGRDNHWMRVNPAWISEIESWWIRDDRWMAIYRSEKDLVLGGPVQRSLSDQGGEKLILGPMRGHWRDPGPLEARSAKLLREDGFVPLSRVAFLGVHEPEGQASCLIFRVLPPAPPVRVQPTGWHQPVGF